MIERVNEFTVSIGFNNPSKRNALDQAMVDQLTEALQEHSDTPTVLVFHSTTPQMFVSGADIAELRDRTADDAMRAINAGLFDRIAAHRWPTIAAVDGYALGGGCELALACDFRIATPSTVFGQPELSLGIMAGAGANWRLPQLIGLSAARRMLLLGERVDGRQAVDLGLIDEVVEADDLLSRAEEMSTRIANGSWRAVELTKAALAQHEPRTTAFDLVAQAQLFESEEKYERMSNFLNRKKKT